MDWIIVISAFFHIISCPYTKVEESFNIQACHDILYNGVYINEYDHLEYPGVVPRTFIGPLFVSLISLPFVTFFKIFGLPKLYSQYVVRFVLGTLVLLAWRHFRLQVQKSFGKQVAIWLTFITASQFHFIYYMSRPLPNIFALIFALLSFSFWLEQRHRSLLLCSGIGVIIFRSELGLLLGPMLVYDLARGRIRIVKFLRDGVWIGFLCLITTVIVDSLFWQRLLWPEGEVLWFNTYMNQSHRWGIYPFLWYWYSCLPRALGLSLILVPVGIAIDTRVRTLVGPALLFVTLYSFLPHKELRFIIYVFPIFSVAAARACQFFWTSRLKSPTRKLLAVAAAFHLLGNLLFTSLLLTISASNYPGGAAIQRFHEIVASTETVHLHIDNLAAQTGVTRFTQLHSHWRYNKTENLKAGGPEIRTFTHLLVEAKSKYAYNLKHYTTSHEILDSVDAFSHLSFNYWSFPPIKVRVKPAIFLLENTVTEDIDWSLALPENDAEMIDQGTADDPISHSENEDGKRLSANEPKSEKQMGNADTERVGKMNLHKKKDKSNKEVLQNSEPDSSKIKLSSVKSQSQTGNLPTEDSDGVS